MSTVITRYHKSTIDLDGQPTEFRFSRFTLDQAAEFERNFKRYGDAGSESDEPEARAWLKQVFADYVRVKPGSLIEEDEDTGERRDLSSGPDILNLFGAQDAIISRILAELYISNKLSEADRKNLQSRRASMPSSSAHPPAADGSAPAATATDAELPTSAPVDIATEASPANLSGMTSM